MQHCIPVMLHIICLGKQVEVLYEPVAVRQTYYHRPDQMPQFGKCHWGKTLRRLAFGDAESEYPGTYPYL